MPVKTDSYRPKTPNSKKKLLGSARLGMSLPWLQPVETPQNHPSVAILDSLQIAKKNYAAHTFCGVFHLLY